jgi:2-phospho-L-lactate/phosphoenolpyruvate guanylyltransferase
VAVFCVGARSQRQAWVLNGTVSYRDWSVVIPVKPFASAKTRLPSGPIFAHSFLLDVISAVRASPEVAHIRVVTADPYVAEVATDQNCFVTVESAPDGINQAVAQAALEVPPDQGIAVILGDLPCLTAGALSLALEQAALFDIAFVSDEAGTGSTMWFSREGGPINTHFGERSRAAHRASGAVEIDAEPRTLWSAQLHRDVDTEVDLWDAIRIGVGQHTADAVIARTAGS